MKQEVGCLVIEGDFVAPCAGAWIETTVEHSHSICTECRPLRGGVD